MKIEGIMRKLALVLIGVILSACASTSGVVKLGNDKYLISRSEKGFDVTGSAVRADAIKEAYQYCQTQGKVPEIIKDFHKDMVPFTSDAQAELEFTCVEEGK
jgi:hypothetical protein